VDCCRGVLYLQLHAEDISVWWLDDFQHTRFPLVRTGIKSELRFSLLILPQPTEVRFDQQLLLEPRPGSCSCTIYGDFFNQRVYGWEPLVEETLIDSISWKHDRVHTIRELQIMTSESFCVF
jgi:hypothetical protein